MCANALAKTLLNQASGGDRLDDHLHQKREALVRSAGSTEFADGLRAFLEKRPARLAGR